MNNKKTILAVILGIGAVISLLYGILTPAGGKARTARQPMPAKSASIQPAPATDAALFAPTGAKRRAKRTSYKFWKRNPFVPKNSPGSSSSFALSGVIGTGSNLKAMIGDSIVSKGDRLGNNTVIDISTDRVILNDGTKDFVLKLEK